MGAWGAWKGPVVSLRVNTTSHPLGTCPPVKALKSFQTHQYVDNNQTAFIGQPHHLMCPPAIGNTFSRGAGEGPKNTVPMANISLKFYVFSAATFKLFLSMLARPL